MSTATEARTALEHRLADICAALDGQVAFLNAADAGPKYHTDWSGAYGVPAPVLRPRTAEAVAALMQRLHAAGIRSVVQGGMTGLVGSAAPQNDEVVVSLELLNRIIEVDEIGATMTVEAGVPLETVQQAAQAHGLFFPVDLGSRGACQIGGMIASNAGGNRVLQYGMTRQSVLGIEVVLPDGSLLSHLSSVLKDNAGYDLKQLFVGSEGTLGIVTRAVLRLQPLPVSRHTALIAVDGLQQVFSTLRACRASLGPMLTSFEVMWRDYFDFVTQCLKVGRDPFDGAGSHLVLLEMSGFDRDTGRDESRLLEALETIAETVGTPFIVLAQSLSEAEAFWRIRESTGEAAHALGPSISFDISIPARHLVDCMARLRADLLRLSPDCRTLTFGHLGDGNVHWVIGIDDASVTDNIKAAVYRHVVEAGGSISAEHGIGFEKRPYFESTCSRVEIDAMRRIKRLFDPGLLLNRDRIFTMPVTDRTA
ncbi:FAD-binding oxidoreductase [Burkholderia multivorans]|uniref:FAD-binding oxidoreductase n=1 Tax=Burkholderia TaxID=32008 RepID=UPI0008A14C54|nr:MULTISPECIES: FAD-binding oxidoreductase [Burkholderia]MBJ9680594.1 FAD-binding oxidoreductase [Burkholderia multivorans]MBU9367110.1 FAD-binding oxidoreductase [Burkholderia multivorans]MBU9410487.1 FAD-binding oxidoreductase [Burkholderia multivorans]MCL4663754.1 FAD-binding oxidoreductase [Burkholderia multivorans]MCO1357258.1 FAD-binding oxidoreductase [Burkholderia multivorans]